MAEDIKDLVDLQKQILDEIDNLKYGELDHEPTLGEKASDRVVKTVGSWPFLIIQSAGLVVWMGVNILWMTHRAWDPYPFILLNLLLSFQAAFTAPIILMASNRAEQRDRRRAQDAYRSIEHIEKMLSSLADKVKAKNGKECSK